MSLQQTIESVRDGLKQGRFVNEEAVKQGAILPILQALGWPVFDTQIVFPEYPLDTRAVDYALCHPPAKPKCLIEAKRMGKCSGGDRQLFEYAFHEGAPLALLTDGQEWHFFLPSGAGAYNERRVYKLDILEREIAESRRVLHRYLAHDAIRSGKAEESARQDYHSKAREREILRALPNVWAGLLAEGDETLVRLLRAKTSDVCGYEPSEELVVQFFRERVETFVISKPSATKTSTSNTPVSPSKTIYAEKDGKGSLKRKIAAQKGNVTYYENQAKRTTSEKKREGFEQKAEEYRRKVAELLELKE